MAGAVIGIDLGTTNSVVAYTAPAGNPRILEGAEGMVMHPSVVSFHPNGSVVFGAHAKARKIIDPHNTVFSSKRLIGRSFNSSEVRAAAARMPYTIKEGDNEQPLIVTRAGEFAVPEISAIMLHHLREQSEVVLERTVEGCVITVPANFNDAQRSATANAGAIAGLTVLRVLNEPTAAALAYGYNRELHTTLAVYDFGGGTFDVSILRLDGNVFKVLSTCGNSFLGGDDIDETLVEHMEALFLQQHRVDLRENEQAVQRLRSVAEQTKIELSTKRLAKVRIDALAYGAGGKPLDLTMEISRDEFLARIAEVVDRTFPVCEEALEMAGLSKADIGDVVLVGGTTKMPYIRERVAQVFGREPRTDVKPDQAVALGAALQATSLDKLLAKPRRRTTITAVAPPPLPGGPPPIPGSTFADEQTTAVRSGPDAATRLDMNAPRARAHTSPLGEVTQTPAPATLARIKPKRVPASSLSQAVQQAAAFMDEQATEVQQGRPGAAAGVDDEEPTTVQAGLSGPVVMDVLPQSLGIGTVAGFCGVLIARNSEVPTEVVKVFTTSRDDQQLVRIRVCQGESRKIAQNTILGHLVLEGLQPRPRGETKIEVTFHIDENGILNVMALDPATGQAQQARLDLVGAPTTEQVIAAGERMRDLLQ